MADEAEVARQLLPLLSALTSTNNQERSAAESSLNEEWIAQKPDLLLVGLAQQSKSAEDVALRSFAMILLRRIAPKEVPHPYTAGETCAIWENSKQKDFVRAALLSAFGTEQVLSVRHKLADLISDLFNLDNKWDDLLEAMLACTQAPMPAFRESAFRVFGSSPELLYHDVADVLRPVFVAGLQDQETIVRLAASQAFSTVLVNTTDRTRSGLEDLVPLLMNVLPPLLQAKDSDSLTFALNGLSELVETYPKMFRSMFADLVNFGIAAIKDKDLENQSRQAALELLVLFAESAPGMCRKNPQYVDSIVVECLSLMTDLGGDEETKEWLETEDLDADESDANNSAGQEALDRLARKLGGKTMLPPSFLWVPKLMSSSNWQERHAALMAISSIAEGCERIMRQELDKVLAMVLPSLADTHPRVRWAACNAVGQMCTDFAGDVQSKFTQRVLNALTPVLDAPETRVAAHAAASFVNFCENADQASLEPYLDPVLERLLNLLRRPQKYVQEQAVTTIATVADAAETKFIKYYDSIMPLLLNVLSDASSADYRTLRGKAMECASLIALAVGKAVFAPQAQNLINLLGAIQSSVLSADDPQAGYLMSAWGRICKVMGTDFLPYLSAVMPPILTAAKLKPDFAVVHDESEKEAYAEEDGWEFFPLRGQQVGIKTSTLEDKNAAVSILALYAQEMKGAFSQYAMEVLKEIAIPGLKFVYHDGVRSASAQLLPELLNSIKLGPENDPALLERAWILIITKLLDLIRTEDSPEIVGHFYQAFYECVEIIGASGLKEADIAAFITATESQLNFHLKREKARADDHKAGDVDLEQDEDILYEIELDEDFLSEISKALHVLFKVYRSGFIPQWQRLLPIVQKHSASSETNSRQWSICVYDDLIEFCGADSWQLKDHFIGPLASGLTDETPEVRQAAAYGIGCAAQHGGEVFSELVAQSLPSLFALIEQPDSRSEENVYATENACVSIAKICRFNASKVQNLEQVIDAWIKTLPVTHDEQDAPYAYRYLGELMDSNHPVIGSQLPTVISVVAQAIAAAVLSGQNLANLISTTKNLFSRLPADMPAKLVEGLQPEQREALTKQFA